MELIYHPSRGQVVSRPLPGVRVVQVEVGENLKGERGLGIRPKRRLIIFIPKGISIIIVTLTVICQGIPVQIASFRIYKAQETRMQRQIGKS